MLARRIAAGLLTLTAAGGGVAGAASDHGTLSKRRTFRLEARTTRTFRVAYPDALKYGRSKYSGRVRILMAVPGERGSRPSLGKVRVLRRGACEGGSEFCARVRNANGPGTGAVRVRVAATTHLPPGKH